MKRLQNRYDKNKRKRNADKHYKKRKQVFSSFQFISLQRWEHRHVILKYEIYRSVSVQTSHIKGVTL